MVFIIFSLSYSLLSPISSSLSLLLPTSEQNFDRDFLFYPSALTSAKRFFRNSLALPLNSVTFPDRHEFPDVPGFPDRRKPWFRHNVILFLTFFV